MKYVSMLFSRASYFLRCSLLVFLFTLGVLSNAQAASADGEALIKIDEKLKKVEENQKTILEKQDQIIELIKQLKIWVRRN